MTTVRAEPELDPANSGKWVLVEDTELFRTYECEEDGQTIVRREWKGTDKLLDQAAQERSDNAGKNWGEGRIIGRVPMNLYYASGLAEAARQRDDKFIKRFWNDIDNRHLRTFEGKV